MVVTEGAREALMSHRRARTHAPFPARIANFKVFNICQQLRRRREACAPLRSAGALNAPRRASRAATRADGGNRGAISRRSEKSERALRGGAGGTWGRPRQAGAAPKTQERIYFVTSPSLVARAGEGLGLKVPTFLRLSSDSAVWKLSPANPSSLTVGEGGG